MKVKILVEGGNMKPGPVLSQKLGPVGINISQVIQKVNDSTKDFKGIKVPVELEVNTTTKEFEVNVFSPPVSELLKKELGLEKGSGEHDKLKVANASIEQIISVAKTKLPTMLCKDLKSAVKTIVGSCVSLGVLVENRLAKEVEGDIEVGKYDREIKEEKTETSPEKKAKLEEYFEGVKSEQEKRKKQEEIAKQEELAKKEEEAKQEGDSKSQEGSKEPDKVPEKKT